MNPEANTEFKEFLRHEAREKAKFIVIIQLVVAVIVTALTLPSNSKASSEAKDTNDEEQSS